MKQRLEVELPIGITRADIEKWVEREWRTGLLVVPATPLRGKPILKVSGLDEAGVAWLATVRLALPSTNRDGGMVESPLLLRFFLDTSERLLGYYVEDIGEIPGGPGR